MWWNDRKHLIAGSLSGFTVRFLTQPLDVVKIRFQLQIEPIKQSQRSYYSGLAQALLRIVKEEGVTALWKGHVPGQLLSVSFAGVEFAVFYGLAAFWVQRTDNSVRTRQPSAYRDLICGIVAGTAATVVCQPFDMMRTRLVAQGQIKVYSGLIHGCANLVREEGFLALWRGLGPACLLMTPQTAITFAVYEKLKRNYMVMHQHSSARNLSRSTWNLLFGCVSGLVAKTCVYPLDLAKKRLAVRGFEEARKPFGQLPTAYTSASYVRSQWKPSRSHFRATWSCLLDIFQREGVPGLFKGWTPSALKAGLSTGLTFYFFEFYLQLF